MKLLSYLSDVFQISKALNHVNGAFNSLHSVLKHGAQRPTKLNRCVTDGLSDLPSFLASSSVVTDPRLMERSRSSKKVFYTANYPQSPFTKSISVVPFRGTDLRGYELCPSFFCSCGVKRKIVEAS